MALVSNTWEKLLSHAQTAACEQGEPACLAAWSCIPPRGCRCGSPGEWRHSHRSNSFTLLLPLGLQSPFGLAHPATPFGEKEHVRAYVHACMCAYTHICAHACTYPLRRQLSWWSPRPSFICKPERMLRHAIPTKVCSCHPREARWDGFWEG